MERRYQGVLKFKRFFGVKAGRSIWKESFVKTRVYVRGKRTKRSKPLALTDTSILLRAWLASLDSLTLIWYISPRLEARYING
jgi:hypothetical protein